MARTKPAVRRLSIAWDEDNRRMRVGKTLGNNPKELWVGFDAGNYRGTLRKRCHYYTGPSQDDADTVAEDFDWTTRVDELLLADVKNRKQALQDLWEGHFGEVTISPEQENANAKRRKRDRENRARKKLKVDEETVVTAVDEKEKKNIDKMSPTELFSLFQDLKKPFPDHGYKRLPKIIKDYTKVTTLPTVDMLKLIRGRGGAHAKKDNTKIWTDPAYLSWYQKSAPTDDDESVGFDDEVEKKKEKKTPATQPRSSKEALAAFNRRLAARKASRPAWFTAWLAGEDGAEK